MREGLTTTAVPSLERQQVLAALGSSVIGFAQEHAAERTAEALQALVPATARHP